MTSVWVLHPHELFDSPAFMAVLGPVLSSEGLAEYEKKIGVTLRSIHELVVASNDERVLVLARGPFDAHAVVRRAGERMVDLERQRDAPLTYRRGYLGSHLWDVHVLRDDALVGERSRTEAPTPSRPTLAAPRRVDSVFVSAPAAPLLDIHGGAPVAGYVLKHIELPEELSARQLLARQRALALSVRALDAKRLEFVVTMLGVFPDWARRAFAAWVGKVALSPIGRFLGLPDGVIEDVKVEASAEERVELRVTLDADRLGLGLRRAFISGIEELLTD